MNDFQPTIPVLPRKGPVQITPDEGDALIRARTGTRATLIDYSLHTAECGNCGDEENIEPLTPIPWLRIVMLLIGCGVLGGLLWLLRGVAS